MTTRELIGSLNLSRSALQLNLEGIDEGLALRSPGGDANTVNWIVGHVLDYRNGALEQLGAEPAIDAALLKAYSCTDDEGWDASAALPLGTLVRALDASQERLVDAIGRLSEADLERMVGKRTLAQYLSFLQFHEAYHAGQVGFARRLLGLPGAIKPPGARRPA